MADDRKLQIQVEAKDEASSKFKTMADNVKESFEKVQLAAAAATAAITAFATNAVLDLGDTGEALYNFSKSTGVSVESASALKMVADGMGSSIETVGGAIKKMELNLNDMASNADLATSKLGPLGLTMEDLQGLTIEEQFFKIGNAIGELEDPAARTTAAVDLFGKSGTDLIPIFADGTASLDEFKAAAEEAGLLMDDVSLNSALALDNAFDGLNETLSGLKQTFAVAIGPAIADLVEKITPLLDNVQDWIQQNPELAAGIALVATGILGLITIAPQLIAAFTIISGLFAFIAANPIVLVIAALAALGAAIYLAITNWEEFKSAVVSKLQAAFELIGPIITNIVNLVVPNFSSMKDDVLSIMQLLKDGWDIFWGGLEDTVTTVVDGITAVINALIETISGAINAISNLVSAQSAIGATSASTKSSTSSRSYGRAGGGSVSAGQAYVVGEGGPETFIPDVRGMIIPSSKTGGGGTTIVNQISGNTFLDRDSAVKFGDMLFQQLRFNQKIR